MPPKKEQKSDDDESSSSARVKSVSIPKFVSGNNFEVFIEKFRAACSITHTPLSKELVMIYCDDDTVLKIREVRASLPKDSSTIQKLREQG